MEANELRIANLIRYGNPIHKNLPTHIITGIMSHTIYLDGEGCSSENTNIIGIPLTEEWLLRFGFKEKKSFKAKYWLYLKYDMYLHWDGYNLFLWCDTVIKRDDHGIKHVHQLQNLYFALTGEELTLKSLS